MGKNNCDRDQVHCKCNQWLRLRVVKSDFQSQLF